MLGDWVEVAVGGRAVPGREVLGRLSEYSVTACSASAVRTRPRLLYQYQSSQFLHLPAGPGGLRVAGHTIAIRGMFLDLPDELRHSVPIALAARLIQQLDIMGRLRLLALSKGISFQLSIDLRLDLRSSLELGRLEICILTDLQVMQPRQHHVSARKHLHSLRL
jgi:hypothetical protein